MAGERRARAITATALLPRPLPPTAVATIRGAKLLELDDGHSVPLDRPSELADAVVAFARSMPQTRE